jgi:hypothetical protein
MEDGRTNGKKKAYNYHTFTAKKRPRLLDYIDENFEFDMDEIIHKNLFDDDEATILQNIPAIPLAQVATQAQIQAIGVPIPAVTIPAPPTTTTTTTNSPTAPSSTVLVIHTVPVFTVPPIPKAINQTIPSYSDLQQLLKQRGIHLSDWSLIAAVVGSAVGITLLIIAIFGCIAYCCCFRKPKKSSWVPSYKDKASTPWLSRGGFKSS